MPLKLRCLKMECVCVGGEGSEKLFSSIWCGLMYFFDEWGQPREFGDLQEIAEEL